MARIRTVKPEFWTSEQVAECSTTTRLLFIGMWNFCDDGGNHPASLKQLKMQIFPSDDISVSDIGEMVDELISNELITQYTVNNKNYWHVLGWHHQKIDKPNYKHPKYSVSDINQFDDHSTNTSRPFTPVRESKGMEGNVMDNNKNNTREHEKNEQSIIDALSKDDTRKNFTLSLDWNPNPSQFGAYCLNNGIAPNQLTNEILKSFCEKANAKGESKTEAQWCLYLAKYLKTCLSNPPPIKPVYQPQQQPEYSDPAYKLFEPLTEAQKQKTPAEDLQRMKKILMGGVLDNE